MSCDRFRPAILDAALGAQLSAGAQRHLETCSACRAALEREDALLQRIGEELRVGLAVEPAKELLPRVRERIEGSPGRDSFRAFRWLTVAALCGLALIALPPLVRAPSPRPTPRAQALVRPAEPVPPPRASGGPMPVVPPPRSGVAVSGPRAPRHSPPARPSPEPEVLVPPGQEAALRQLMAGLRGRRLDADSLRSAAGVEPTLEDLLIAALEIPPLVPLTHD